MLLKKHLYNTEIKNIENKVLQINSLVTDTTLNAKYTRSKTK